MSDFFYNIVHDLMVMLGSGGANIEPGGTLKLTLASGHAFTLEMTQSPIYGVLIFWEVGTLPQVSGREQWVKEALRWNINDPLSRGVFSYSIDSEQLCLHHIQPLDDLSATQLFEVIQHMHEKVSIWSEALGHGQVPLLDGMRQMGASFQGPMMAFRP